MNHIAHGCWISTIEYVAENELHHDRVISVCQDACRDNVGVPYEHFPLADDAESKRNWGGTTEYSAFADAADSVLASLRDDAEHDVIVHCHRGRNRSAAVCAAALAVYRGSSYHDAKALVGAKRPQRRINDLMDNHAARYVDDAMS